MSNCPPDSAVGYLYTEPQVNASANGAVFNMVPKKGVAAEFGFQDVIYGTHVLYAKVVPSPQGYVLQVSGPDVTQIPMTALTTIFYGDPAAKDGLGSNPVANFTNPSDCDGQPLTTTAYVDTWETPGQFNADGTPDLSSPGWVKATSSSPPVTGCNLLSFSPSLSVQPDTSVADSPAGVDVDISVPQTETPGSLATPPLENGVGRCRRGSRSTRPRRRDLRRARRHRLTFRARRRRRVRLPRRSGRRSCTRRCCRGRCRGDLSRHAVR